MKKKNSSTSNIKSKKINYLYWFIYSTASRIYQKLIYGLRCDNKEFKEKCKKSGAIVVYNHVSNKDHFTSTAAFKGRHVHYVITKYFYFNKFLSHFLNHVNAIPKDQFSADMASIKLMKRATDHNHIVAIAPAGQVSVHGGLIFVDEGIVKLVRLCKTDVFALQIRGNYLAHPKWSLSKRKAKVRTKFVSVIDKDEIKSLTDQEIYTRICKSIDVSDIREQKENKIKIKGKARALGIENILYVCPKCKSEFKMTSSGHYFWCEECGNKIYLDQYGLMQPASENNIMFENEEEWYKWENNLLLDEVRNNKLHIEHEMTMYRNHRDEWKMEEFATGILTLTNNAFIFDGTDLNGNHYHKEFALERIFQLPWKPNSHFEINGDEDGKFKLISKKQPNVVVKYVQAIDALRIYTHKK